MRSICSIEDCKKLVFGQGLCQKHYMRMRRKGNTDDERKNARGTCAWCENPTVARGLCDRHYRQVLHDEQRERGERGPTITEGRICAWCYEPIAPERRPGALYCGSTCKTLSTNEKAKIHPDRDLRQHAYNLKHKFGITPERYQEMFDHQEGRCAICDTTEAGGRGRLHVDHCHDQGHIRGLLCNECNIGLGKFKDNPDLLKAAIDYLSR